MSMTTLADVARDVGVSASAASLALNGKPGVSEKTRSRVVEAAERLRYRPNPAGRALRQSRIGAIGIYVPSSAVHYGYYSEVNIGIAERLHRDGSSAMLLPNVAHGLRAAAFPRVDGFIMVEPHSDDPGVLEILAQELPVVSGDRPPVGTGDPWGLVESPTGKIMDDSFALFSERNAQRPGLLLVERVSEWSMAIERHYLELCARRRCEPRIITIGIDESQDELRPRLASFFAPDTGSDAVFVAGDGITVRIAGILSSLGKKIGEDVLVISGVDSPLMEYHTPPITSIDLQPRLFGRQCAELLLELIEFGQRPASTVCRAVPAHLIKRASA